MASPVTVSVADGAQTPHIVKVSKHSVASLDMASVASALLSHWLPCPVPSWVPAIIGTWG